MLRRPKGDGRCVHCRKRLEKKTKDHVFPASWYPDSTPANVQRWTVPSCEACNNKFGAMEVKLLVRLAMCIDPRKQEASGVWQRARESLGIGVTGLDQKEARIRKALKDEIMREAKLYDGSLDAHVIPRLGPHAGFPKESQIQIEISANAVQEVAKKILRGCEFWLGNGRIIEPPHELEVFIPTEAPEELEQHLTVGPNYLGPGCRIRRAVPNDEPQSAIYEIVIWDTLKLFFSILPSDN